MILSLGAPDEHGCRQTPVTGDELQRINGPPPPLPRMTGLQLQILYQRAWQRLLPRLLEVRQSKNNLRFPWTQVAK